MATLPRGTSSSGSECTCCDGDDKKKNVCINVTQTVSGSGGGGSGGVSDHEALANLKGGKTGEHYHMTADEAKSVARLVATTTEVDIDLVPTIIDGTHFELDGDHTDTFKPGMTIKIGDRVFTIKSVTFENGKTIIEVTGDQLVDANGNTIIIVKTELGIDDKFALKNHGIHLTSSEYENLKKLGSTVEEIDTGLTPTIIDDTHLELDGDQTGVFQPGMTIRIGGRIVTIKSVVYENGKTIIEIEGTLGDAGPISIITVVRAELDMEAVQRAIAAQVTSHNYSPEAHEALLGGIRSALDRLLTSIDLYVPPTDITITSPIVELEPGGTYQLGATVEPDDATNKAVAWASNNTAVATVDQTGKITAIADGTATITVTTQDKGRSAACNVTVKTVPKTIAVTGITLNATSQSVAKNGTYQLVATVAPSDATNQTVTWSSSNATIATVSESGLVTAKAAGNATITVTTADGAKAAACVITVTVAVTGVVVSPTTVSLAVGATYQLTATVQPADATY